MLIDNLNARIQKLEGESEQMRKDEADDIESDKEFINKIKALKFSQFRGTIENRLADP